jgi:hypothetical protein
MSQMLDQLKKIINSESPVPAEKMRIKYKRMKDKSAQLTNSMIEKNQIPPGQGCAYIGGFPV